MQPGNRETLRNEKHDSDKDQLFEHFSAFIKIKGLDLELNEYLEKHWRHEDVDLSAEDFSCHE